MRCEVVALRPGSCPECGHDGGPVPPTPENHERALCQKCGNVWDPTIHVLGWADGQPAEPAT